MLCIFKGHQRRNKFPFRIGSEKLQIVQYKYLGIIFHEKQSYFYVAAETLAKAGGRALGGMISKIHFYKDVGFRT